MRKKQFLQVSCPRCRNRQIIFSNASYEVKCFKCNYLLSKSTGGRAKVRAPVRGVL
ncbi:30S ribosomal protein S27e [Candidatus Pacearchaeota archaeon]|nr:30S ribosomal protein S27e [Candidatus Pacearchaeota archaeon]